jgi:hypothetical protein
MYEDIIEESMDLQYLAEVEALAEELDIEVDYELCFGEIFF